MRPITAGSRQAAHRLDSFVLLLPRPAQPRPVSDHRLEAKWNFLFLHLDFLLIVAAISNQVYCQSLTVFITKYKIYRVSQKKTGISVQGSF